MNTPSHASSADLATEKPLLGWSHMPKFGQGYARFAASSIDWDAPLPQAPAIEDTLDKGADEDGAKDHLLHSFWTTVTTLSRTQRLLATR